MKIIKKTLLFLIVCTLSAISLGAQSSYAGVYGHILKVGAKVGSSDVLNGGQVSFEDIKRGGLKYTLEVLKPTQDVSSGSNASSEANEMETLSPESVDKWIINLVDEFGNVLGDFELVGDPSDSATYSAVLKSVTDSIDSQKTIILKAQAEIDGEKTNSVAFKVSTYYAGEDISSPVVTPVAKSGETTFPWLLVLLLIALLAWIIYVLAKPKPRSHIVKDIDDEDISGAIVNIYDGKSRLVSHQKTDEKGIFSFAFRSSSYVIEIKKDGMAIVETSSGKIFNEDHITLDSISPSETLTIVLAQRIK